MLRTAGRLGVEDDQQDPRVLALFGRFAMLDQDIAGQPDQVIGMVHDIGHDDACLAPSIIYPCLAGAVARAGLAEGQGDAHRCPPERERRGSRTSWASNQSRTAVLR